MAGFWNRLREEVSATVTDFKEKGAAGAFRDAALDARDMAKNTGGFLVNTVKSAVVEDVPDVPPVLHVPYYEIVGLPTKGSVGELVYADGATKPVKLLDFDLVSEPPRAKVEILEEAQVDEDGPLSDGPIGGPAAAANTLVVDIVSSVEAVVPSNGNGFIGGLKNEWHATVQDFREKGAVGTLRDSVLDAVDIAKSVGGSVAQEAKSVAGPLFVVDENEVVNPDLEDGVDAQLPLGDDAGNRSLWGSVRHEWRETVQDFRDKGVVGALKDATLDAVDIVGNTASTVAGGAKMVGGKVYEQMPAKEEFSNKASTVVGGVQKVGGWCAEQIPVASLGAERVADTTTASVETASVLAPVPAAAAGTPAAGQSADECAPAADAVASRAEVAAVPRPAIAGTGAGGLVAKPPEIKKFGKPFVPQMRGAVFGTSAVAEKKGPAMFMSMATPREETSEPPRHQRTLAEQAAMLSARGAGMAGDGSETARRKSLVEMRKSMFEKKKVDENEEVVD